MTFSGLGSNRFTNATLRASISEPDSLWSSLPRTPDHSAASLARRSRCACGARVDHAVGIYCSLGALRQNASMLIPDCARNDAFSSLTHTRSASSSSSLGCAFPDRSSRAASASDDDEGSHYRRVKRDERRERDARMRQAGITGQGSLSPELSTRSPSAVPDLVSSHSRNTSTSSSVMSLSSMASLSRNPSTTSSYGPGCASNVVIDDAIMEDDNEAMHDIASARSTLKARRRVPEKEQAPVHAGQFMVNDMLDEIINMEESFMVPEDRGRCRSRSRSRTPTPERQDFVPNICRAPRTPSPVLGRRGSVIPPGAPNAPCRRRSSLVHERPPSLYAHQPSLSESHSALYLATASPVSKTQRHRRSASPMLSVRRSLTFNSDAAGPALPDRFDSPGLTPVRRKHLTPNAHHPPMQGWRFPTATATESPRSSCDLSQPEPAQPFYRLPRTTSLAEATGSLVSPPASSVRLGMLLNSEADADDDTSTLGGGSLRQSLAAPVAPFTQPGW